MVDDGWQATEVETVGIVEIHTDADGEDSAMVGSGKDSTLASGETDNVELPRTLFSWAEFMAEPVAKRKGRPQDAHPSLSLFEWAVAVEQTQEEERVAVTA